MYSSGNIYYKSVFPKLIFRSVSLILCHCIFYKGKVVNRGPYQELSLCKGSTDIMACLIDPETEAGHEVEAKDAERLMVARQLSRQDTYPCHRLSKVGESTHSIMSATTTLSVYVSLNPLLYFPTLLIIYQRKLNLH